MNQILKTSLDDPTCLPSGVSSILAPGSIFHELVKSTLDRSSRTGKELCGMRYHPLVLAFALAVYNESHASFRILSDVLGLPSETTLKDYNDSYGVSVSSVSQILFPFSTVVIGINDRFGPHNAKLSLWNGWRPCLTLMEFFHSME